MNTVEIKKEDLESEEYDQQTIKLEPNEEKLPDNNSIQADEAALIAQSLFMVDDNDQHTESEENSGNFHHHNSDNNSFQVKFTNDQHQYESLNKNGNQIVVKSLDFEMVDSNQFQVKKEEDDEEDALPSDASSDGDDDLARRMKLKSKFASSPVKNAVESVCEPVSCCLCLNYTIQDHTFIYKTLL